MLKHIDVYGFQTDCGVCAMKSIRDMNRHGVNVLTEEGSAEFIKNLSGRFSDDKIRQYLDTAIIYAHRVRNEQAVTVMAERIRT